MGTDNFFLLEWLKRILLFRETQSLLIKSAIVTLIHLGKFVTLNMIHTYLFPYFRQHGKSGTIIQLTILSIFDPDRGFQFLLFYSVPNNTSPPPNNFFLVGMYRKILIFKIYIHRDFHCMNTKEWLIILTVGITGNIAVVCN